jgi:hypothetical protein
MYGMIGAGMAHAFHARRHMHKYGTTSEHLGAVGRVVGAQHAARELLARLHAPTMATADAVRPLD